MSWPRPTARSAGRIRLRSYGTSNLTWGHDRYSVLPAAREAGIDSIVSELPERVPYLQAMAVLRSCDIVLVMGSADQYYHASKLYPAIVSGRPVLAICHAAASIRTVMEETGAGICVTFEDAAELAQRTGEIRAAIEALAASAADAGRGESGTVHGAGVHGGAGADSRRRGGAAGARGGDVSEAKTIGIGVIGLGHWGPNQLRIFSQCAGVRVVAAADLSADRRKHVGGLYRDVEMVADAQDVFKRGDVDAVVIATPAKTHFAIASAALQAGKHVLLEKPMCTSLADARGLVEIAERAKLALVHGHVFVYNAGIRYLHDGLAKGSFGDVQYVHATRTNLGPIRRDVNVVEDLATHELTIFDYLFGCAPTWVSAAGSRLLGTAQEDVAFVTLQYGGSTLAHVHASWLNPQKVRTITLVANQRMVVWDDMEPLEQIRVYDKGVMDEPYYDSFGEFQLRLRDGDIVIPRLQMQEPLKTQADTFLRRVRTGELTPSESDAGLRVAAALEAIARSLAEDGRRVPVAEVSKA